MSVHTDRSLAQLTLVSLQRHNKSYTLGLVKFSKQIQVSLLHPQIQNLWIWTHPEPSQTLGFSEGWGGQA